ncbi:MAG: chemotaxis protein CheB [Desulfobacterales bacterium]|nr:chemotaxis protein CheB [Desulfobacterales bacterium]
MAIITNPIIHHQYKAIVIGVSAGGFNALHQVLPALPKEFPLSVAIVQHRMNTDDNFLIESLNNKCQLWVKEAEDKEPIQSGVVYIAPAGYHLLIESNRIFSLSVDELVNYSRPSIDVLFESAADAYGYELIGIVMTGANYDGKEGIRKIKEKGGLTIVQDPRNAEVATMPLAAISTQAIDYTLPLHDIAPFLIRLSEEERNG